MESRQSPAVSCGSGGGVNDASSASCVDPHREPALSSFSVVFYDDLSSGFHLPGNTIMIMLDLLCAEKKKNIRQKITVQTAVKSEYVQ